jgi:hypothetical protein
MTAFCSIHRNTVMFDGGCPDCAAVTAERHPEVTQMFARQWIWVGARELLLGLVGRLVSLAILAFIVATIWKAWSR